MIQVLGAGSFQSIWYWALTLVLWTYAGNWVLGVPYDMMLRAARQPEVGARLEALAHIFSDRLGGLYDRVGAPIAAIVGFGLAMLLGFAITARLELAAAAFVLVFPLAIVAYSTLRLALAVRRQRMAGPRLIYVLRKRRLWHLLIGATAILVATAFALSLHRGLA